MANRAASNAPPEDKDPLAHLIRSAGRRPPIAPGREQRVHKAVRETWLATVRKRRIRRAAIFIPSGLIAAGILITVISHYLKSYSSTESTVASVEYLDGSISEHRGASDRSLKLGDTIVSGSTVETTSTSRAAVRLANGPSLRMDHSTRVRVQSGVLVLETGAVYVDTAAPAGVSKKAILIQTGFAEIQDVGTQFEVRLEGAIARPLAVRVREGHVDFKRGTDKVSVAAGEELTSAATGQFVSRKLSPTDSAWDWASACAPSFSLEGSSLESAATWICREQGWELKFDSEAARTAAKSIRLHGSLDGISPKKALDAIVPAAGMKYAFDGATLHIKQ
jgi:hypothetical protein